MARTTLARRRASVTTVRRGPSPKLVKLEQRIKRAGQRARAGAQRNEQTLLTLLGATLPALAKRNDIDLPTIASLDPALLWGGGLMAISLAAKGRMGERLFAVGTGMTAPALARAVETGSMKVAGDDDDDDDPDDEI